MLLKISAAAAALVAATAIAGAASAQDQAAPASAPADQTAPAAAQADANATQTTSSTAATSSNSSGYNVGAPQTDPNTGAQVVTNGPVPDTAANRARFGKPDSHAGKRTAPAGN